MVNQDSMAQPTLGAQLAKLKAETAAEKLRRETEARAAVDEKFRQQYESVVAFFVGAQAHIVAELSAGREPKPYLLGNTGSKSQHMDAYSALQAYQPVPLQNRLDSERAPFSAPWHDLQDWARENELKVVLAHAHDGVGVHGWYELVVSPAVEA